ncbi:MAG: Peptidase fungalysin, partial [Verrucomicrobiales bacterium]|nr:Peptidase fungalysin [Verrucomicrobiales bacterium]
VDDPGSQAVGSPSRVFNFPLDLSLAPSNYTSAAVVNLFYWNNWMHDKLYDLGFDEASGNFQNNTFGRGGDSGDAVQADAQDASISDGGNYQGNPSPGNPQYNNANFFTPIDGNAPRMQMYLWNDGSSVPKRDGDLDSQIICHEYTHGLSSRLVGGGIGISGFQTQGMGEGWSDFVALSLLSKTGDDINGIYPIGSYLAYNLNNFANYQTYYFGIRRYPYCANMSKNPLTFKDIDPAQASAHAGVPKNPMFGSVYKDTPSEPHEVGEVWCSMLWDCRALMMGRYGNSGNQLMLLLVVNGMKLSPENPTFVDSRDAILQADLVLNNAANHDILWQAFARRGLGYNASCPQSSTTTGAAEDFGLPPYYLTVSVSSPKELQVFTSTPSVSGTSTINQGYVRVRLFRLSDGAAYNFNSGTWVANWDATNGVSQASGVASWTFTLPTLPDGRYELQAQAVNTATSGSDWTTRNFVIDATAPTVSFAPLTNNATVLDLSQLGGTMNKPSTVYFRITEYNVVGTNRYWNGSSFVYTNQDSVWLVAGASGNTWNRGTNTLPTRTQMRSGHYFLDAESFDAERQEATAQIVVIRSANDTTPPNVTIDTIAPNQIITNNFLPGIGGTANDAETGIGNIDIYLMQFVSGNYLYWTGSGWSSTATALHPTFPTGGGAYNLSGLPSGSSLPNGTYQVQVYAQNRETPPTTQGVSVNFTVEFHPIFVWTEGSYTDNIDGNENHHWDNPANWNQGTTPTADSMVVINGGTCDATMMGSINNIYRVDIGGGTLQVNGLLAKKLNVSSGFLTGGAITVGNGNVFNWSGGQINGTYSFLAGSTVNMFGSGRTLGGGGTILNNSGTINWTNGPIYNYAYYAEDVATINNQSNATFNIYGDGRVFDHAYNAAQFNNLPGALFVKANSFGTNDIGDFTFNNGGEVRVNTGAFKFDGGITLNLQGGSVENGLIICEGVTVNVQAATTIASNNVSIRNSTLHCNTNSTVTTSGSAALEWVGGTLDGVLEITPNSQLVLNGSTQKTFNDGAILRNRGRVYWLDSGNIYNYGYYVGTQGTFENLSGAYFYINTDASINRDYNKSYFNNRSGATVVKGSGSGTNQINWQFNNDGLVTCNTGAMTFNSGGNSSGEFSANTGTALRFGLGTHTLNNGTVLSGSGRFQIDGETVTRNGTIYGMQNTPTTLDLISGTFDGIGTLAQKFDVNWTSATIGGQLDAGSNVTVNITGNAVKTFGAGALLNNYGTVNWSGPG